MDDPARAVGGTLGDYVYQQGGRERPMSEVFKDIVSNLQEMVRSEVRLARAEIREETSKTVRAGAMLAAGGVLGISASMFLLVCVAQLLSLTMPSWAASLIVGLAVGVAAAILISNGRKGLVMPTPDRAIESVKENVEWMKNQTKS
jgi:uncharacterized membrane protein YqjE